MTKKLDARALKQSRGTKRTCQNSDCGDRFYDLDRTPIVCPICASPYVIPSMPVSAAAEPRKAKRPEEVTPAERVVVDAEAALADTEAETEDEPAAAGAEVVLEVEEDEGDDVSNIIGGPLAKDEKER